MFGWSSFRRSISGTFIGWIRFQAEEMGVLAERGINALWLIGLWERSTASQTIKRLMGQHDAVASAYSLKDYRIAEDLGGTYAYERLRDAGGTVWDQAGIGYGAEPYGHRFDLGDGASGVVSFAPREPVSGVQL